MNNDNAHQTLLEVSNLSISFPVAGRDANGKRRNLLAVDEISFAISKGKTLGLVGESGSGKTTTAYAVARLIKAQKGSIKLNGEDFLALNEKQLRQARRHVQFIFQDPFSSLNPRLRAEEIIREPLLNIARSEVMKSVLAQQKIIDNLFSAVGLLPEQKRLFPHQFSGGQRQRIAIARALATNPQLIICDEPVSALDVAVQAQILNLLRDLQKKYNLSSLFISHDLGVIQHMCNDIAVMYMGKIVEYTDRNELFNNPLHPYTIVLLSAVLRTDQIGPRKSIRISGERPDLCSPPKGCQFASRCPVAEQQCHQEKPALKTISYNHQVACHLVDKTGKAPLHH